MKHRKYPKPIKQRYMNSYQTDLDTTTQPFFPNLEENMDFINKSLFDSEDYEFRTITFNQKKYTIAFIASIVDKQKLNEYVIQPLNNSKVGNIPDVINTAQVDHTGDLQKVIKGLIEGQCAILSEGNEYAYLVNVFLSKFRRIKEPANEYVIRGSHDGFIECLQTNITYFENVLKTQTCM
jgi:spore germination protein KA